MRTRIAHFVRHFALLVLCGALSGVSVSRAQDSAVEREAKAEFELGVSAASAQEYATAREHFMRSRQLVVKASTLLNLAITDLKLGLFDEAMLALDAIEAPEPGPEQKRLRQRARKLRSDISALRESVTQARAEKQPPAEASRPEDQEPAPTEVNDEPWPTAAITLASSGTEPDVAPAQTAIERREPQTPAPSLRGARTLLALGGALGLGALGSALWWYDRHGAQRECLNEQADPCREKSAVESEKMAATAVTIGLGAASVGLIVGGAIWLVSRKEARTQRVVFSLRHERRSLGLVARVTF